MSAFNSSRIEGARRDPQTDLWSEASSPAPPESRHDRVRRIADDAIANLSAALEQGKSEALREYLAAFSRFHRYSFHNALLIAAQRPDATHVAGFRKWLELERSVMRGEKGIAIVAPVVRKGKADPPANEGSESEEHPAHPAKTRRFRVVYVFDISQTEGKPLPEPARVGGDPGPQLDRLKALAVGKGIAVEYAADLGGASGTSSGGRIQLLAGLGRAEEFAVLAHEVAHEFLHWEDRAKAGDKRQRETEAEAVAYVVTSACGLKTGTAASDYIQFHRGDRELLAQSLERVQSASSEILAAVLPEG